MIIIWHNKYGDVPVNARDPDEEIRAYFHLFQQMDNMGFYSPAELNADEQVWYATAKDQKAPLQHRMRMARFLLRNRSDQGYEYEKLSMIYPETP